MYAVTDIITPYFNGNTSFLVHPSLVNAFAITYLYIEIRPYSLDGLILFNGQSDGPDYITILLRSGLVEYHYNLGGGSAVIVSNYTLTMGEWHSIEARRNGRSGSLIVNNQMPITRESPEGFNSLQLSGDLMIGGFLDMKILPAELHIDQRFHGCVRELQTQESGNQPIPLINAAVGGVDIGDCPACSCANGGDCFVGNGSYYCNCPLGYTGLFCESELCAINNPCQNSARCYVRAGDNGSTELACNCSLPFGGETCNDRKCIYTLIRCIGNFCICLQVLHSTKYPLALLAICSIAEQVSQSVYCSKLLGLTTGITGIVCKKYMQQQLLVLVGNC